MPNRGLVFNPLVLILFFVLVALCPKTTAQGRLTVSPQASPTTGAAPLTVQFSARGSEPSERGKPSARYHWEFGDGSQADGATAKHQYLKPGPYRPTVTYTRYIYRIEGNTPEFQTASNSLTITVAAPAGPPVAQAVLGLAPAALNFDGRLAGSNPPPQSFNLTNLGESPLQWTVQNVPSWLHLEPVSGSLNGRSSTTVAVMVNSSTLAAGVHKAQFNFISTHAGKKSVAAAVTFNLLPPPPPPTKKWPWLVAAGLLGAATLAFFRQKTRDPGKQSLPQFHIQTILGPAQNKIKIQGRPPSKSLIQKVTKT